MTEKEDLVLALYSNMSRGYNASAQRLVTSIFGWLAFVAFVTTRTETGNLVMPLDIIKIISFILLTMSAYFWYATHNLGAAMRYIEEEIAFSKVNIKITDIVNELPKWRVDELTGWSGRRFKRMTIGELVTIFVIIVIYLVPLYFIAGILSP